MFHRAVFVKRVVLPRWWWKLAILLFAEKNCFNTFLKIQVLASIKTNEAVSASQRAVYLFIFFQRPTSLWFCIVWQVHVTRRLCQRGFSSHLCSEMLAAHVTNCYWKCVTWQIIIHAGHKRGMANMSIITMQQQNDRQGSAFEEPFAAFIWRSPRPVARVWLAVTGMPVRLSIKRLQRAAIAAASLT